jgi:hypothetical protein
MAGYTAALDNASLGREAIKELRAILKAVVELAKHNDVILALATVGVTLADDRYSVLHCAHSNSIEEIFKLEWARHG